MYRKTILGAIIVMAMIGIGYAAATVMPERLTHAQLQDMARAELMLAQAGVQTPDAPPAPEAAELPAKAPDEFKVKFECSNGVFVVACHKDWAPLGVQRFYELVKTGFYEEARFFRVVPGFVVQFGLPGDPAVGAKWFGSEFRDDPVKKSNEPGAISFATRGPNSRTTQVFINLGTNANLDGMGFAPFGEVVEGFDVVKAINPEYDQQPDQGQIRQRGNAYLESQFPRLDFIKKATIILDSEDAEEEKKEDAAEESPAAAPDAGAA